MIYLNGLHTSNFDKKDTELTQLEFDVFWSVRSPYCYLAMDRLLLLQDTHNVQANLRVVYPIAVREPEFFEARSPDYFLNYLSLDTKRVAARLRIPFRWPVPDPIVQNLETAEIADSQPYIHAVTRLLQMAVEMGQGWTFAQHLMRLLWNGETDNWHEGRHMWDAIRASGLDPNDMFQRLKTEATRLDEAIIANQAAQRSSGHRGVPLFVYEGEPFFGQDRLEDLVWRLNQNGLSTKAKVPFA